MFPTTQALGGVAAYDFTIKPNLSGLNASINLAVSTDPAHVLMDLTLHGIAASLMGTLTTEANGVLVPEPTTAVLLAIGVLALRRR